MAQPDGDGPATAVHRCTTPRYGPAPCRSPSASGAAAPPSKDSVDLAARYGDPLFSANVTNAIEPYAKLVRYYRERWAYYGRDPALVTVGAATAGYYAHPTSQVALETYRPVFEGNLALQRRMGLEPVFHTLEDFVERSSALIGSPAQVIEKVQRYHDRFGHRVLYLHADAGGLTQTEHRDSLELFQSWIPPVLRRVIPDPPWPWGPVLADPLSDGAAGNEPTRDGALAAGTTP